VNNGDKCTFVHQVGCPLAPYNMAMDKWQGLRLPSRHVDKVLNAQSSQEVLANRLRLMTSIKACKWLSIQGCAFKGHDKSPDLLNHGNFIELIKSWGDCNEEMKKVVLENALGNAKYTLPKVQKEILNIHANKVRNTIHEKIRNAKYCTLVDEALDEGNKEQMAIVLRFVDSEVYGRERFFDIVVVVDTNALTLKSEICTILGRHDLQVQDM